LSGPFIGKQHQLSHQKPAGLALFAASALHSGIGAHHSNPLIVVVRTSFGSQLAADGLLSF
jgi:hypothetical protein